MLKVWIVSEAKCAAVIVSSKWAAIHPRPDLQRGGNLSWMSLATAFIDFFRPLDTISSSNARRQSWTRSKGVVVKPIKKHKAYLKTIPHGWSSFQINTLEIPRRSFTLHDRHPYHPHQYQPDPFISFKVGNAILLSELQVGFHLKCLVWMGAWFGFSSSFHRPPPTQLCCFLKLRETRREGKKWDKGLIKKPPTFVESF